MFQRLISFAAVAAAIFGAAAIPCRGAEAPVAGAPLDLASALARALRDSPDLQAYALDIRAAEARLIQARLKPNPELSLTVENPTGSAEYKNGSLAEQTLQLSQLVELGGKRHAWTAAADLDRVKAGWDYQVARVAVLKEVTLAFVEVLAVQERLRLAREIAGLAADVAPVAEKRVRAGRASEVELMRGRIATASANLEVENEEHALATARAALAAALGTQRTDFGPVAGDLANLPALPSLSSAQARLRASPQLGRWTIERERREAVLRHEMAKSKPDISVMGGPRVIGRGDEVTVVVGVSIPWPRRDRNQGGIAEAEANLAKVDAEQKAAENRAQAELIEIWQTLERARHDTEILQKEMLPSAAEAVRQLTEGYATGRFSQLEILDASRTLMEAREQHLHALQDYHKAMAELEALTAAPMEPPAGKQTTSLSTAP